MPPPYAGEGLREALHTLSRGHREDFVLGMELAMVTPLGEASEIFSEFMQGCGTECSSQLERTLRRSPLAGLFIGFVEAGMPWEDWQLRWLTQRDLVGDYLTLLVLLHVPPERLAKFLHYSVSKQSSDQALLYSLGHTLPLALTERSLRALQLLTQELTALAQSGDVLYEKLRRTAERILRDSVTASKERLQPQPHWLQN